MSIMLYGWTAVVAGMVAASASQGQRAVAADAQTMATVRAAEALLRRPVTLDVRGVSLRCVVDVAAARAKVSVQYRTRLLEGYMEPFTLHLRDVPLGVVLPQMLSATSSRVVLDGATQLM